MLASLRKRDTHNRDKKSQNRMSRFWLFVLQDSISLHDPPKGPEQNARCCGGKFR